MTKLLAIDLHDTICGYLTRFVELYGWPWTWDGRLRDWYPKDLIDKHFEPANHAEFLRNLQPYKEASKVLWKISEGREWDPVILTATKDGQNKIATMSWWNMWRFPEIDIVFAGDNAGKIEYIVKHDIQYIIDDQPEIINAMAGRGREVLVYHTPWNENVAYPHYRVQNWLAIANYLGVKI